MDPVFFCAFALLTFWAEIYRSPEGLVEELVGRYLEKVEESRDPLPHWPCLSRICMFLPPHRNRWGCWRDPWWRNPLSRCVGAFWCRNSIWRSYRPWAILVRVSGAAVSRPTQESIWVSHDWASALPASLIIVLQRPLLTREIVFQLGSTSCLSWRILRSSIRWNICGPGPRSLGRGLGRYDGRRVAQEQAYEVRWGSGDREQLVQEFQVLPWGLTTVKWGCSLNLLGVRRPTHSR